MESAKERDGIYFISSCTNDSHVANQEHMTLLLWWNNDDVVVRSWYN